MMRNKLLSRKFLMAVVAGLLVIANDGLDLGLSNETILGFASIVIGYVLGESYVDSRK